MKLLDFLAREQVVPELLAGDKRGVLQELAEALGPVRGRLTTEEVVDVLLERERLGSTGIGDGIAIPHGKLGGVDRVVMAFGRSRKGIDFESLDGAPVYLFFLLLSPTDSASIHLMALARVARLFKSRPFRELLLAAADSSDIFDIIAAEDAKG